MKQPRNNHQRKFKQSIRLISSVILAFFALLFVSENASAQTAMQLKIVLVGDAATGKTALMNRFVSDQFDTSYKSTIGADFTTKVIEKDGNLLSLQIWDTAGHERFQGFSTAFYRGANAFIFVYDITSNSSFEKLNGFLQSVRETNNSPVFAVVGNKSDLENKREVSAETGRKWMEDNGGVLFFETSAKTGDNVEPLFHGLIQIILWEQLKGSLCTETATIDFSDNDEYHCLIKVGYDYIQPNAKLQVDVIDNNTLDIALSYPDKTKQTTFEAPFSLYFQWMDGWETEKKSIVQLLPDQEITLAPVRFETIDDIYYAVYELSELGSFVFVDKADETSILNGKTIGIAALILVVLAFVIFRKKK